MSWDDESVALLREATQLTDNQHRRADEILYELEALILAQHAVSPPALARIAARALISVVLEYHDDLTQARVRRLFALDAVM